MPDRSDLSTATLSIAVVDDHDVIHSGVRSWCAAADPPIAVADCYFDSESFLAAHPHPSADVQAVVLDLELTSRKPDFAAIARIADAGHRVVVYSHLEHNEVILQCLDYGAVTYLVKSEGKRHLIDAIRAAGTDTAYVGPRMAGALHSDSRAGRPALAAREREVLVAWFQTESKELVGQRLFISPATVRTHLQRIRAKYAAAGRPAPTKAALVARAIQDGMINVDDL
ncbi:MULTISPECIES: response regulator transcription factor [Mycolicibacterium]|uniref:response regulator transcription factor n=1 Tax=Mycolicibacterium TaxID=1866885 RepID=UPI00088A34A9|nr:response regulator transcription factor [Mycolicibacterium neoaurum]SDC97139.1 DNA-binding response regulator, NarL/FixJ family, contains REC and HTH domains [Mycolicibacterium neoaurum]